MGLINSGVTGIQVAQMGLATTSHNIANASTAGYNRQRIVQASNVAMATGSGFVGQGAHVSTVERMYSKFLNNQVNSAQTQVSSLDSYYAQISQIDNMLADTSSGLSPALQDFFTGVQQVAANPSQVTSRQAMVSSAQALVARFQSLNDQLSQMYDSVNGQIAATVSTINSYATQIGDMNEQIIVAQSSDNQPANDLLDQRDQLVAELNKLIKVTTTTNTDGSFNVFIGTGQQLVVGTQVSSLVAMQSSTDASRITVGLKTYGGNQELPESLIRGGSLGGLLSFRSETLDATTNDLGRTAASLALTFNAQHALGQDLLGQAADTPAPSTFQANFFSVPVPTVVGNTNNAAAAAVTAALVVPTSSANYTNLTNSDYRLDRTAGGYTLTRLTDGNKWSDANIATLSTTVSATEGFTFAGTMAVGDSFTIEPTRDAAKNLTLNPVIAADPRLIAAAAPIKTVAGTISATNVVTNTNKGSATISAGSVATGYSAPASGSPITLTYHSGTGQLTVSPPVAVTVTNAGTTTNFASGAPVTYTTGATISFSGMSFEITGTPSDNDTFVIARNLAGTTDARNALALGKLQTANTMSGKTASYQGAYAQLVSDVGNKTREVSVTASAQQALVEQATSASQSLSGVNLDEEAANLIRYQQAYQASAKVVDLASKLFDTLLAIGA